MWAPRWAIFSTATVGPADLPRPQSGPPRAAMVQVGNLIGRTQMPHDQAVSGDVDRMHSLESPQLRESICCVAAARVELRDHLVLFCDPLNTGSEVPNDQSQLPVKNDATRLRCVDADYRVPPLARRSAIRMECSVNATTCTPAQEAVPDEPLADLLPAGPWDRGGPEVGPAAHGSSLEVLRKGLGHDLERAANRVVKLNTQEA